MPGVGPYRAETYRVEGLSDFLKATAKAEKKTKKAVRDRLREAADIVRVDASRRFAPTSAKSAAGYRTVVRARGISVEQSLKLSKDESRRRPKWSILQLSRAVDPAVAAKSGEIEGRLEEAMDDMRDIIEGRGTNP